MTENSPTINAIRNDGKRAAIVFIHGFSGNIEETWGQFPSFLASYSELNQWDIYSFGYATRLRIDIVSIWSADPSIDTLADLLRTTARAAFGNYDELALVAHSMGGLVVQRALVDDDKFTDRVKHVLLFGTPSAGLEKASLIRRLKRQVRDMAKGSDFIKDLRSRWSEKFDEFPPFGFLTVAGDQDEFVPRASSSYLFLKNQRGVVPGNHLQIVKPENRNSLSVLLVLKELTGKDEVGVENTAVAKELSASNKTVKRLEPNKEKLDGDAVVELALAMERIGRNDDALQLLESAVERMDKENNYHTDMFGTLAGRLKRRWILYRIDFDAERSLKIYSKARDLAVTNEKWGQAFYNGINAAFMQLAYKGNLAAARKTAQEVLDYCSKAAAIEPRVDPWRLATEGEANLILGKAKGAIKSYRASVQVQPSQWKRMSTYQQAVLLVGMVGDSSIADELDLVYRTGGL